MRYTIIIERGPNDFSAIEGVDSVVAAVQQLQAPVITAPTGSPWGRRAVILDPDGRAIEVNESKKIDG